VDKLGQLAKQHHIVCHGYRISTNRWQQSDWMELKITRFHGYDGPSLVSVV